ncbi:MAG: protein-export chaperone SecB [Rhodospirillales bacterium]|nr:protein-export chaperone SecB [Rhodospirillales bacterium]
MNTPKADDAGTENAVAQSRPAESGPAESGAEITLHSRYIKDMSFENTGAPAAVDKDGLHLDISVGIDVRRRGELYEVVLSITATALQESEILFIAEVSYAGLFEMPGIEAAACERFAFQDAPRIMFPFVDRIIADVTRDGGYPPLNLTPPDWTALYPKKRAEV